MRLIALRITCPDGATARTIATALVEARLAACVHVEPGIESVYRWQGAVETATEIPLFVKTRAEHLDAVAALVRARHPYETPAIVGWDLAHATEETRAWALAETECAPPSADARHRG